MITEDYVSFEIAKLLKEKGFIGLCTAYYDCFTTDNFHSGYEPTDFNSIDIKIRNIVAAPTLQMAMKWLREVHNLFIFISTWLRNKDGAIQYYYEIRNLNDKDFETIAECTNTEFDSYEKNM
jgi:hypothetical protein